MEMSLFAIVSLSINIYKQVALAWSYITVSNIFFSIYSTGVFCKVLTDPYGGAVTVNNRTVGAVAHYKCYLGHNMYGQATRECHADGQWFPAVPLCKSESKHFKVEEHGLTSCSFL